MHSRFKRQWAKAKEHQLTLFPSLEREDRLILVENLTENSRWSMNFGVMLGCSVIIAGLGLLQDSVAVIIGAMQGGVIGAIWLPIKLVVVPFLIFVQISIISYLHQLNL